MEEIEHYPVAGSMASMKLPFSEAVRVGDILYLSGQVGTGADGKIVPGGIEPETGQALENIKAVLESHDSSMDRVVKVTVMLADIAEWAAMNSVYVKHFTGRMPARSAFGASGLALAARVEIECIAVVRKE
jgi:2-iminobutanoate/2-iminopropanoate deaminase